MESCVIHSRKAEVKALVVKSVEGKPTSTDFLARPLIKGDEVILLEIQVPRGFVSQPHVHSHSA